jgi:rubrerythrin
MNQSTFSEAIDFAVRREQAAVEYYRVLAALASFAAQKATLLDFMAMEEGHVTLLTGIKRRGSINLSQAVSVDLGLAERLAAEEELPPSAMGYQDILREAIKKEDRAYSLYVKLAAASGGEAKDTFDRLAAEESRHRRYFEELYEKDVERDN